MRPSVRLIISAALLVGTFLAIQLRSPGEAIQVRKPFSTFPQVVGTWQRQEDSVLEPEVVGMLKLSDYLLRRYVDSAGHSTGLYIGYWQSQRKGSDIHSPKNCLPGGGWDPIEASRLSIPLAQPPGVIIVNRYLIQKDNQMQVVIYWFQAQGTVVAGELDAKIEMVRSAIFKNRTDGALVRISSPVHGTVQETTARLIQYVQALYPILGEYLPA